VISLTEQDTSRAHSERRGEEAGEFQLPYAMKKARTDDREVLFLAVFVVIAALLLQVTPDCKGVLLFGYRLPESCGLKRFTGNNCPGCGLTRSFILGIRADPRSIQIHRLGPLFLLVTLFQIPYRIRRLWRTRQLQQEGLVEIDLLRGESWWRAFRTCLMLGLFSVWLYQVYTGGGPP